MAGEIDGIACKALGVSGNAPLVQKRTSCSVTFVERKVGWLSAVVVVGVKFNAHNEVGWIAGEGG